jgi:hypothetical protein
MDVRPVCTERGGGVRLREVEGVSRGEVAAEEACEDPAIGAVQLARRVPARAAAGVAECV